MPALVTQTWPFSHGACLQEGVVTSNACNERESRACCGIYGPGTESGLVGPGARSSAGKWWSPEACACVLGRDRGHHEHRACSDGREVLCDWRVIRRGEHMLWKHPGHREWMCYQLGRQFWTFPVNFLYGS